MDQRGLAACGKSSEKQKPAPSSKENGTHQSPSSFWEKGSEMGLVQAEGCRAVCRWWAGLAVSRCRTGERWSDGRQTRGGRQKQTCPTHSRQRAGTWVGGGRAGALATAGRWAGAKWVAGSHFDEFSNAFLVAANVHLYFNVPWPCLLCRHDTLGSAPQGLGIAPEGPILASERLGSNSGRLGFALGPFSRKTWPCFSRTWPSSRRTQLCSVKLGFAPERLDICARGRSHCGARPDFALGPNFSNWARI
jgi:hypothetical protein